MLTHTCTKSPSSPWWGADFLQPILGSIQAFPLLLMDPVLFLVGCTQTELVHESSAETPVAVTPGCWPLLECSTNSPSKSKDWIHLLQQSSLSVSLKHIKQFKCCVFVCLLSYSDLFLACFTNLPPQRRRMTIHYIFNTVCLICSVLTYYYVVSFVFYTGINR